MIEYSGRSQLHQTTPMPNFLLDRVMPRITDTEWRLLCVIVRQTFGWQAVDGSRKTADWLSHYQLRRRTGRASAAISEAIDTLCRAGLIIVKDRYGMRLFTRSQRRRSRDHLTFSLNPLLGTTTFQQRFRYYRRRNSISENNKTKFYKRKQQTQSKRQGHLES